MKGELSIKVFPHPTKIKNGKHQLFIRLTLHRKKVELATKFYVPLDKWEIYIQKNNTIDEELTRIKREIYRIKNRLEDEKKPVSASLIKDVLTERVKVQVYLLDFFQSFVNRISSLKEYTKQNVGKYAKTKEYLGEFLTTNRKVKDVLISQVDYKFISDFDDYMISRYLPKLKRTMDRNTVNQHHTRLRTILLRAIRENIILVNPYQDFPLTDEVKAPKYLTDEELQRIIQHPLGDNPSLQRVRDIFIFSVYTGLRFTDAQKVKVSDIRQDKEEEYYLYVESQNKTEDPVMIPLFKPVVAILHRYDDAERKVTGYVLPRISNQKTNTYLKIIADLIGLTKNLTHHVARHTCATTVLLSNDVSLEATGKWLGQKSIKSTQIYAKVTNQYLKKVAQHVKDKI